MEYSPEMTINYLRERLLSERSISKTAKQRADELSKRVVELEEQLKNVYLQRKKAEKAAADVLAILENNGITDVSEAYDSSSDQEGNLCESKVGNNSSVEYEEETSASLKARRNDAAEFSSSELESPAVIGRSLSWKSSKNSPHSLEKRYIDSSRRRRGSFASTGSSSSRVGKSCRQIRKRDTRSVAEEFQMDNGVMDNQGSEVARCSKCYPNSSVTGPEISREVSENLEVSDLGEDPTSGVLENQNGNYSNGHGGHGDMERALEQQAQLIGRYESEEKAQREWEEKYRENNSCTPDSYDPGTHSDVTEERDEIKTSPPPPPPLSTTGTLTSSQNREAESGSAEEPQIPNSFRQDHKSSIIATNESPPPEFAVSMSNGKNYFQEGPYSHEGESSNTTNELALMPHEPSNNLGSVLEALQLAKLSLKQNLIRPQLLQGVPKGVDAIQSVPTGDRLDIPRLFRVPTDFQFNASTQSKDSPLSLTNYSPEFNPYMDSRDRFLTGSGVPTMTRPVFMPSFDMGPSNSGRLTYPDPRSSDGPPYGNYTYPTQSFPPELMSTIPPENLLTRSLPNREVGMPPMNQFSFYDHNTRPNMYR